MTAALPVLLALSVPLRAPDLQVEARTAAGANLPELADAVARALVASGVRVVLGGPASEPCVHCAQVAVTELEQGICRIDISQERHNASANLHFGAGSPLFDRARAIAIHARLLITWETSPDAKAKDVVVRQSARKSEPREPVDHFDIPAQVAEPPPVDPQFGKESEPAVAIKPEPVLAQVPVSPPAPERNVDAKPAPAVSDAEQAEAISASQPPGTAHPPAQLAKSVEIRSSNLTPPPRRWPWIPTALGSGAAIAAGICAIVARNRYSALSDKSRPYDQAIALKMEGERWQAASYVFSGVAVAGLATGLIGFVARPSKRLPMAALATPIPGGGMIALTGDLP